MKRFRVWLARLLTKGTDCCVVRSGQIESLRQHADELADYVQGSGGLQDPRRIRAYRTVLRVAVDVRHDLQSLVA